MFLTVTPDFSLPLADPVLKFLIILVIILASPLLLNRRLLRSIRACGRSPKTALSRRTSA